MLMFCLTLTEYSKDLPTYLQFCKDVAFVGLEPSFEDHEEQKIIVELWDFYMNEKVRYSLNELLIFSSEA